MSIATAIANAQSKVADAYTACNSKGATMPAAGSQNLSNLASTISSIVAGGGTGKKLVTGTFTTNSTAGAQTITIPYTGSGFPIAAVICLSDGLSNTTNPTWYNLVQRYAIGCWSMFKDNQGLAPTYATSGSENAATVMSTYKNSASDATSFGRGGSIGANTFSSNNAAAGAGYCVRFKSSTTLSVYVATSQSGLVAGMDFTYFIIYSS